MYHLLKLGDGDIGFQYGNHESEQGEDDVIGSLIREGWLELLLDDALDHLSWSSNANDVINHLDVPHMCASHGSNLDGDLVGSPSVLRRSLDWNLCKNDRTLPDGSHLYDLGPYGGWCSGASL